MTALNLDVPPAQFCATEREATALLEKFMNKVKSEPDDFIGMDTETHALKINIKSKKDGTASKNNPLDWMSDTVTFWSLAAKFDQNERWCLPQTLLYKFIPLLECPDASIVTWNGKYDAHVLYNSGVYALSSKYIDGMAMANLVDENLQGGLSLKEVCGKDNPFFEKSRMFDVDKNISWGDLIEEGLLEEWDAIPMTKFTELFPKTDPQGKRIVEFEYSLFDLFKHYPDRVIDYASLDAHATLLICEHLRDILLQIDIPTEPVTSMWEYFCDVEIPITKILWQMERRGLAVDREYLEALQKPMGEELLEIEKQIFGECGWHLNLRSTDQLRQLFFGDPDHPTRPGLGLEPKKMTKGGKSLPAPSTDKTVLDIFAADGVQIAKLLKRHREVSTTKSTFVEGCLKLCMHYADGRLHPKFNQFGARTGRFTTNNPNSQNQPRPDTDEFGIRNAFIAAPGKVLIVKDFKQLEIRIVAHFSQDEGMIFAIHEGMDMHCFAVEKMYGISYDEVYSAKQRSDTVMYDELTAGEKDCLRKRQTCKNTGFAIIYGAGAPRISVMLEIPIDEAKDIVQMYFDAFPGVKNYMTGIVEFCRTHGYVMTLIGRRRRLKDINSHVFFKRSHAEREAGNAPIQGSGADIVKAGMINITEDPECQSYGLTILNQIHDELVMECPEETAVAAEKRATQLMEFPFGGKQALCVPTPTDGKIVTRWADAK